MMSNLESKQALASTGMLAIALASGLFAFVGQAATVEQRQLSFYHTHTQEHLQLIYSIDGEYVDSALEEINAFLADFRTGDQVTIDPHLLDLIYDVRASLVTDGTFEIISAYRSPKTNEMLRRRSNGVARNSQHVLGN